MPRNEIIEKIPLSERMYLFRPCVGSNKYPGLISSSMEVFPKLGVETVISDEQTCCGGFLTFSSFIQPFSVMPAVARNIVLAEERGLDILTLCNGCYAHLTEFSHFMNDRPQVKEIVNKALSIIGLQYSGSQSIFNCLEIIYKLKDRIKEKVTNPLTGLKFAAHYGCHYLNSFKKTAIDDAHMPTSMEEIIETVGGEAVSYVEDRSCCGTGLTQIILNKEEIALPHTKVKLDSLKEAEPDAVVVICPYCLSQLDRMQYKFNYRKVGEYNIPVMHLVQLVGLALGMDHIKLGFEAHVISFDDSFMNKLHKRE